MNWPTVTFGAVADIVTGTTPPMGDTDNYGPGVPWVKPPDLDTFTPITSTIATLSSKGQSASRLLPAGAVMVCCIGATIGRVGIAGTALATNQQINSLVFGPLVEPKFGYYFCLAKRDTFRRAASSAGIPILNKTNFGKLEMPLPPISEQKRIVEILDHLQEARKNRHEFDDSFFELPSTVFHEIFGDLSTNSKQWTIARLSEIIVDTRNGLYKPAEFYGNGIPILKMFNIQDGELNVRRLDLIDVTDDEYSRYCMLPGDILLNRVNTPELVGKCAVITNQIGKAVFESKNIRVRVDQQRALPDYVAAYINSPAGHNVLRSGIKHAIGMATVNGSDLVKIGIPLPPLKLQQRWASIALRVRAVHEQCVVSRAELQTIFSNLLQRALTGELTELWRNNRQELLKQELREQQRQLRGFAEVPPC
jgi:type I restriction enzyme S subunit